MQIEQKYVFRISDDWSHVAGKIDAAFTIPDRELTCLFDGLNMHFYLTNKEYIGTYKSEQFWINGLVDAAYIDNGIIVLSGLKLLIHLNLFELNIINVLSFEYVSRKSIASMYPFLFKKR